MCPNLPRPLPSQQLLGKWKLRQSLRHEASTWQASTPPPLSPGLRGGLWRLQPRGPDGQGGPSSLALLAEVPLQVPPTVMRQQRLGNTVALAPVPALPPLLPPRNQMSLSHFAPLGGSGRKKLTALLRNAMVPGCPGKAPAPQGKAAFPSQTRTKPSGHARCQRAGAVKGWEQAPGWEDSISPACGEGTEVSQGDHSPEAGGSPSGLRKSLCRLDSECAGDRMASTADSNLTATAGGAPAQGHSGEARLSRGRPRAGRPPPDSAPGLS